MLRLLKATTYFFLTALLLPVSSMTAYAAWTQDSIGWKYEQADASIADSWKQIDGLWYHFNEAGYMDTGWYTDRDSQKQYLLGADGAMLTGTQIIDNHYFSFNASGELLGPSVPLHIAGLDNSLLEDAIRQTDSYWAETEYGLSLVNAERVLHGLTPLALDKDLCNIANYRSAYMERTNYFEHYIDGVDLSNTVSSAYYGKYTSVGENIHCNYSTDGNALNFSIQDSVLRGFNRYLQSPSHYQNMMDPTYRKIGIGIYSNPSNTKRFFTQIFQ